MLSPEAVDVELATIDDLPQIVDIYNYSAAHSIANFSTRPTSTQERQGWFQRHSATGPHAALFEHLVSEPIHVALAGIALPNDASIALHRKFGFSEVGTFREYALKNGQYISSLWMQRLLREPRRGALNETLVIRSCRVGRPAS